MARFACLAALAVLLAAGELIIMMMIIMMILMIILIYLFILITTIKRSPARVFIFVCPIIAEALLRIAEIRGD